METRSNKLQNEQNNTVKRKILFITYAFPPKNVGGVFRIIRFIKYLSKIGWQVLVITPHIKKSDYVDKKLLKDIPNDSKIFTTNSWEPLDIIPNITRKKIITKYRSIKKSIVQRIITILGMLFKKVVNVIFIPDDRIIWYFYAKNKAKQIVKQNKPDIIISSSPPATCHLIANLLHKKYNIPWIVDFRDEWTINPFTVYPTAIHKKINKYLEKKVCVNANIIINTSTPKTDAYKKIYSYLPKNKFITIYNGFDPDDFRGNSPQLFDKFTITYTGNFYGHRTPFYFLKSLEELITENIISQNDIQIIFAGTNIFKIDESLNLIRFNELINFMPYLSHEDAIKLMRQSTILLLIISKQSGPGSIAGKIFEYMASQRPILSLSPAGIASSIIQESNTGCVCEPDNLHEIKKSIIYFYNKWKNKELNNNCDYNFVNRFNCKKQAVYLNILINNILQNESS